MTSPFTTGSILLTKTHRLPAPAGLNGAPVAKPVVHYLGVKTNAGSYDVSTTPKRTFSTSLGTVTFNPGSVKFFDYACVNVGLGGPAPAEAWIVCFNQKTRDALDPPDVWLTTQDLGQFPGMRVDPLDEVCVQATVQP